jgi:glycogen debranching enzyme
VEITNLSMRDVGSMALLEYSEEEWMTPAAGYPLYPAVWARDALTAAWQAAVFDRGQMVESILSICNRTQGTRVDDHRDEEPGRIIRQMKRTLPVRLGKTPKDRYYADFSSPFMFIIALGNAYAWSGKRALLERHYDAARRVLDWAREYGDKDGDGYLEYKTQYKKGPKHQAWKDADNAIVYEDGSQVEMPIATAETQGYWYASLQFMAVFSAIMGDREDALAYWKDAKELKKRFNRDFWVEEEGIMGLGLDPQKRLIKSVTSNAGQCITTGIIEDEKLPRVVRRLFQPDMFSGWGIRTLSTKSPAYNPLAYHLGSVWPVENGTILFGLRRFGFDDRALELARALYDLARVWSDFRIPECVGGYARDERPLPAAYPRANSPQAWNQSVFPILVQMLLGMRPVAALNLLAVHPLLPAWLPEITLKNLRVGDATVTLRFWRDKDGDSLYEVVEQQGSLHLINQPPLDALGVGIFDRLGALAEGVLPF